MESEKIVINENVAIPLAELRFTFTRSSGPGGQHVNRSATQVELWFDVANSPSLTELQRSRVRLNLRGAIDSRGILHITDKSSRSQFQNREEAVARFQELLRRALRVPRARRPTAPSLASRERRLAKKRRQSDIKQRRQRVMPDE